MLLAMAVLLLHPQLAATGPLTLNAKAPVTAASAAISDSAPAISAITHENSAEPDAATSAATVSAATEPEPEAETGVALPDAPAPVLLALASPGSMAFIKSGRPMTVSVAQLQAEDRRKEMLWKGLTVASSSAAMFDAASTRHAITTYGAVELNPLLRPFAGNSSLFAAIQVAPALLDFAGKKMMYSRHTWLRRVWFVPQSASFVSSILCGAHNLSYR
ncbi:MAG TPA: hypothetical protein VKT71_10555 [Candidatus Acidoferrales bacterium]|nr:hypothetical protein [Candidatus Acidoferrales bacterium]